MCLVDDFSPPGSYRRFLDSLSARDRRRLCPTDEPDMPRPRMSAAAIPTEAQEQATLLQWAAVQWVRVPLAPGATRRARLPLSEVMYAVPNGEVMRRGAAGYSDVAQAVRMTNLKRQGFRFGVPDLVLPVPRGPYAGLYVELKRRDGGRLSPAQAGFIDLLAACGYSAQVAAGAGEAIDQISAYLALDESRLWAGATPAFSGLAR